MRFYYYYSLRGDIYFSILSSAATATIVVRVRAVMRETETDDQARSAAHRCRTT